MLKILSCLYLYGLVSDNTNFGRCINNVFIYARDFLSSGGWWFSVKTKCRWHLLLNISLFYVSFSQHLDEGLNQKVSKSKAFCGERFIFTPFGLSLLVTLVCSVSDFLVRAVNICSNFLPTCQLLSFFLSLST